MITRIVNEGGRSDGESCIRRRERGNVKKGVRHSENGERTTERERGREREKK